MLDKHHSYQSLTESLDQSVYRVSCLSFNQESNSFSLVSGNVIAPHLGEHHQHYDVVAHRKYSPHNSQWSKFSHRLQWLSGCCDIHGGVVSPGELEWVSVSRELTSKQLTAVSRELVVRWGDSTQVNSVAHWSLACPPTVQLLSEQIIGNNIYMSTITHRKTGQLPSFLSYICENTKPAISPNIVSTVQTGAQMMVIG